MASRRCVHKQQVLCTRVQSNTCNTPRASIACQSATAHSFRSVRTSRGSLAGSSGPVLLGRRTGFFLFAAVKPSMSGFAETGGQQTFDWGRPLQPRCLLACCLRAEFKKTAWNCLISEPCRGRSFVLGKQASSTAVHHHHPASSSSSSSFSLSLSLPNIAAWLTGRLKQFSLVLR